MEKKRKYSMPYYTNFNDFKILLDEIKNRPKAKEGEIRARVKNFERSRSALIELGLVRMNGEVLCLTDTGKKIAWETDSSQRGKALLADVVLKYEPYEVVLTHALRDLDDAIETEYVQKIWGQYLGIQLSAKSRGSAVATFFQLLEESGLGKYKIGRRGSPTRLEFTNKEGIQRTIDELRVAAKADITEEVKETSPPRTPSEWSQEAQPPTVQAPSLKDNLLHFKAEPYFDLYIENSGEAFDSLKQLLPLYKKISLAREKSTPQTEDSGDDTQASIPESSNKH